MLTGYKRPVIVLGHGVRMAGATHLLPAFMDATPVPVLTSWQAADLVDNNHPAYFGRPGVYGQRLANSILASADLVIAVGCRLSQWVTGYNPLKAEIWMVDVCRDEVDKIKGAIWVQEPIQDWLEKFMVEDHKSFGPWLDQCEKWQHQYPWLESPTHDDPEDAIHSYRFVNGLQQYFSPNEIIVTDAGSFMCPAFQVLRLKPPQRLMTSGGLGEMGCGIPMAVGAAMATKQRVICLVGDGGAMMNLQELQTIVHHRLPVKIIVFRNDGYKMIKATQDVLKLTRSGVAPESGLSFPNFNFVARAFRMSATSVFSWKDFHQAIPAAFESEGPSLIEYHMDPEQPALPKLNPIVTDAGIRSPALDELSPVL